MCPTRAVRRHLETPLNQRGHSLIDLILATAVLALTALMAMPALWNASRRTLLNSAAAEVTSTLALARATAIRYNANVGVRFELDGQLAMARLYRDGDGDGVRNADIASGADRPFGPPRPLGHIGSRVRFGFPPGISPADPSSPGRPLPNLGDPIRFNQSNLAVYDPLGTATPGSIYLTDSVDDLLVVRVQGRTGRVRVLRWNDGARRWQER